MMATAESKRYSERRAAVDDLASATLESVAEAFLMLLRSRGIRNFFINAGTDFAPIVESYARMDDHTEAFPRPVIAGHENVSMGMAHGAYLMSGQPQAVMFHVNVGTANAACAAMNAAAENVPIMICAGRSPVYEGGKLGARNTRVAWAQEMYDQAAVVRECVKWEYELRGASHVGDVVDRALTIAMTQPRGPVYLTLPREVLAEGPVESPKSQPQVAVPTSAHPDPEAVGRLADELADARMPVISALSSGADQKSVKPLAELCERYAIGYAEEQARYLNLPSDHPLHLGYAMPPVLGEADAWLFVESDVPWIPSSGEPRETAFVAQAGMDPNFSAYPMRTHRSDLTINTGASSLFAALADALEARKHRIDGDRYERLACQAAAARARTDAVRQAALSGDGPITTDFLSAVLGSLLHDDCVLFNEYWGVRQMFAPTRTGSYFYLPATGGLGWALPAALGAKTASPERTMIAAVGDGTYMFSNPTACHHASQKHGLPILTVVANNSRWDAVNWTARLVYPEGHMSRREWMEISDLRPSPAYEQALSASGGAGLVVSERSELENVLRHALRVVEQDGRQAMVNVLCE